MIAILQPFTTVVETQNGDVHSVIQPERCLGPLCPATPDPSLCSALQFAHKDFVEHPQAVADFTPEASESVQKCNDDPDGTADLVVQAASSQKPIAQAAIPGVQYGECITGVRWRINCGFLQVMSDANRTPSVVPSPARILLQRDRDRCGELHRNRI